MQSEAQRAFLATIAQIPAGRVSTYGQIAELSGYPGAARAVGRALSALPKHTELPWHRVLNAQGKLSSSRSGKQLQRERLESEGVVFVSDKISLEAYRWYPE